MLTYNDKNELHGWCEWYHENGKLWQRCVYINDCIHGYFESYDKDGSLDWVGYYLNDVKISEDNEEGYCYIWGRAIA